MVLSFPKECPLIPGFGGTGNCKNLSTILVMNVIVIYLYFRYFSRNFKNIIYSDPLNEKVIKFPIGNNKNCCSWWPVSHFIVFTIYSYIWPQYSFVLFLYGILWEICEIILNLLLQNKNTAGHQMSAKKVEYDIWWGANWSDILFNTMGIMLGRILHGITK